MSTSAPNTAELPEIISRIRYLETCTEENPSLWHKPAYRSAVNETLWKLNGRLTDHIDLKIFQDKEHLENFLGCSRTITSAIERLGLVAINEFNREPEPQSNVVANAENSSIEQASNPAAELGIYQEEDYILDDNLVTTGSRSSIDRSEDFDRVFTRHSDNQLALFPTTSLDDNPLNADGSSIADDESYTGKDNVCAKKISTAERDKPSQPMKKKKKKKSKKKKITVENSAEEATITTIETSHSPNLVLPMAKDYLSPASSTLDRLIAPSDAGKNCLDQAVVTTSFSETQQTVLKFTMKKASEELTAELMENFKRYMIKDRECIKRLEEARQQLFEGLKAEYGKALADLTKKYEAIKFENKNLKADRNKELEKLRKENSILHEKSSTLDQEVTELREEIQLLNSKSVKEESQLLPEAVVGHAEELDFIIRHQCHIIAYEKVPKTYDTINRREEKEDENKPSTRLKFAFKTLQGVSSWDITTYQYMSEGARKLCKVMKKIRVSNAILRARCQWYWNELHQAEQTKKKSLVSLLEMEKSAIMFEAETFDLKDRIRELEKSLNIKKRPPGLRAINREKEVMQERFGILELTISELKDEVNSLKEDNSKLLERKEALLKNSATGELRQTAQIEEELCEEQLKTKRLSSQTQELQEKVKALEEERAIVKPLIDVGVAVRKRFFEQAKYTVSSDEVFSRVDYKIIKEGNDRCHRAYCLTDAALFKLFYLSGSTNEALYNKIYHVTSYEYVTRYPYKLCQAIDSKASIKTVRAINDSNTSQELRTEAEQLFSFIVNCYIANPQEDIFDANKEVTGWLSQLKDLEGQIVRIGRSIEYRGYVENTTDEGKTSHTGGLDWDVREPGDMGGTGDWTVGEPGDSTRHGDWDIKQPDHMASSNDWATTNDSAWTSSSQRPSAFG
ncbi:hypothetical protein BTUL_0278g00110 [Botrytis tulipae]|uniref:Uncharacterized protein n=1 Tax=Botrytis tulipae TaxID=87230 RepID=A0A4Z1E9Z6_9HELO|nr:hypothetical protein BTUL_0278g00110 [Botrytis tulipae]